MTPNQIQQLKNPSSLTLLHLMSGCCEHSSTKNIQYTFMVVATQDIKPLELIFPYMFFLLSKPGHVAP